MPNEQLPKQEHTDSEQSSAPSYTPASPQKRIWAWVGVIYMVMIVLLFTYQLAHGDTLKGIAGLMLAPAIGGVAANGIYTYHARQSRWGLAGLIILLALCGIGLIACLAQGIPSLFSNL